MVSHRFLVPRFEVRVLVGQPRSFGVAVNTSACHAEDHGFDSRKDRQHTVAEWLRRGLQILVCEFDSHRCVQRCVIHTQKAGVVQ